MGRLLFFSIFALACLVIVQREKFSHRVTRYTPAPVILVSSQSPQHVNEQPTDSNNYYRTGKYDISLAPVPTWNPSNPSNVLDLIRYIFYNNKSQKNQWIHFCPVQPVQTWNQLHWSWIQQSCPNQLLDPRCRASICWGKDRIQSTRRFQRSHLEFRHSKKKLWFPCQTKCPTW